MGPAAQLKAEARWWRACGWLRPSKAHPPRGDCGHSGHCSSARAKEPLVLAGIAHCRFAVPAPTRTTLSARAQRGAIGTGIGCEFARA